VTISETLPTLSASAEELAEVDRRHLIHPLHRGDRNERVVIVKGRGSTVWDAEGNELLDATGAGNWVAQVGHGRQELADAAARQMADLEYFTSFDVFSNENSIRLAARLSGLAPAGFDRVFYTSGGSEGVDTAIKAARLFHRKRGEENRTWIIARRMGYHGSTYGGGSATGFDGMAIFGPTLPNIEKVSPPWLFRAAQLYGGEDPTDFLIRELEQTIERIGAGNIAAMIGEPVMGGGGVLVPPTDYWPRVRELLTRNGILLIADEVVTGYGRTGVWFASEDRGMSADIIVTAKGITSGYQPLGAVLLRGEVGETVAEREGFFHGYTYFGHPVACAVALRNLDLIEQEGLVAAASSIGDWLRAGLAPATQLPVVGDIRIAGAMVGIELVADKDTLQPLMAGEAATEVRRAHGVVVRDYGNTIVISPPFVFEQHEANQTAAAVIEVLSRLSPDGRLAPR